MKLAALYTVFNGLELLEKSVEQIYDRVDMVILSYQTVSNTGNHSSRVEDFVHSFTGKKFHLLKYVPDLKLNTKENERRKFRQGIHFAAQQQATHFFISATDHFYKADEFDRAKKQCEAGQFDVSFTSMYTYYKHPTWRLTPIEDYYMPFICRLHPHTQIVERKDYPVLVDPALRLNTCDTYRVFSPTEIMMHHHSMVRKSIRDKLSNAATAVNWSKDRIATFEREFDDYDLTTTAGIQYFRGRKIKVVPDHFRLASLFSA